MNWKMKEVVLAVILSIVCGVLYMGWSTLWVPIAAVFGPVGAEWMYGIWVIASPLVAYIVRKPGAAFIAEMAAASVELFTGVHFGMSVLLVGFFQGIGAEIAFAVFRYRRYDLFVLMLSGMFAAVGSMIYGFIAKGYLYYEVDVLFAMLGLRLVSAAILGGLLAYTVVNALAKTGVLDTYQMMRERRQHVGEQHETVSRM